MITLLLFVGIGVAVGVLAHRRKRGLVKGLLYFMALLFVASGVMSLRGLGTLAPIPASAVPTLIRAFPTRIAPSALPSAPTARVQAAPAASALPTGVSGNASVKQALPSATRQRATLAPTLAPRRAATEAPTPCPTRADDSQAEFSKLLSCLAAQDATRAASP